MERSKKDNCILMSSQGLPYQSKLTIKECGIKNGDKIILI